MSSTQDSKLSTTHHRHRAAQKRLLMIRTRTALGSNTVSATVKLSAQVATRACLDEMRSRENVAKKSS